MPKLKIGVMATASAILISLAGMGVGWWALQERSVRMDPFGTDREVWASLTPTQQQGVNLSNANRSLHARAAAGRDKWRGDPREIETFLSELERLPQRTRIPGGAEYPEQEYEPALVCLVELARAWGHVRGYAGLCDRAAGLAMKFMQHGDPTLQVKAALLADEVRGTCPNLGAGKELERLLAEIEAQPVLKLNLDRGRAMRQGREVPDLTVEQRRAINELTESRRDKGTGKK